MVTIIDVLFLNCFAVIYDAKFLNLVVRFTVVCAMSKSACHSKARQYYDE